MREEDHRLGQRELRPTHIQVSRVTAVRVVGHNVRLVLEGNALLGRVLDDGNGVLLPRLAAVEGTLDENSIAGSVVAPVIRGAQLVEGDVAQDGVAVGVISHGNVAGNFVIFRRNTGNNAPGAAGVFGVRDLRGHLVTGDHLPRI